MHVSDGIRTNDTSNLAAKTYDLDRAATGTGLYTWSLPGGINNIIDSSLKNVIGFFEMLKRVREDMQWALTQLSRPTAQRSARNYNCNARACIS
jgi:hypothetical protein